METVAIQGELRTQFGKTATRAVLKAGRIPCVIYGLNSENIHLSVKAHDVRPLVYTGEFKVAEVNVGDKTVRCIVKHVDYHPIKDTIRHIDFLQLIEGHPVKVEVPLRFKGDSPGVRNGGKFIQHVLNVKIKAKPEDLVDEVIADISKLKLGQVIRVRDIQVPAGVEILMNPSIPVAGVVVPRSLKGAGVAEEEEAAEGGEAEQEAAAES